MININKIFIIKPGSFINIIDYIIQQSRSGSPCFCCRNKILLTAVDAFNLMIYFTLILVFFARYLEKIKFPFIISRLIYLSNLSRMQATKISNCLFLTPAGSSNQHPFSEGFRYFSSILTFSYSSDHFKCSIMRLYL